MKTSSDFYGISRAIQGAAQIYFSSARMSGRSTALINALKDSDCVLCTSHKEADYYRNRCKRQGLKVTFIAVNPKQRPDAYGREAQGIHGHC